MDLDFRKTKLERHWQLPCALCGGSITNTQPHTEIETRDSTAQREQALVRVWHKDCYHQFLEDGEEL